MKGKWGRWAVVLLLALKYTKEFFVTHVLQFWFSLLYIKTTEKGSGSTYKSTHSQFPQVGG